MTTSAQSIIYQAQRALLDKEGVRATASDLVKLLNMAQRDIQFARQDTTAAVSQVALVAGPRQTLPDVASVLIDIPANASGLRSRITKVDLGLLDALERNWRSKTAGETVHFMHDPTTPRQYHVYPPATAGALVDMEYSAYPVDIPEPAAPGLESSTVTGDISLTDQWANTLLMVTLYYAYMTDLEGINNIALASGYLQRAEAMLGVQLQASVTVSKPK
jgi:hypothetical protein